MIIVFKKGTPLMPPVWNLFLCCVLCQHEMLEHLFPFGSWSTDDKNPGICHGMWNKENSSAFISASVVIGHSPFLCEKYGELELYTLQWLSSELDYLTTHKISLAYLSLVIIKNQNLSHVTHYSKSIIVVHF